ncbi:MAG: hypothetical protein HUU08_18130 [Candidatus Brocadia sp.]|nr:hypothetical protein [Candidatus Brocadia sp.]UJS17911.1 MAG: hypothetical protein L3J17_02345 [Candidatus Jettenia sp.]
MATIPLQQTSLPKSSTVAPDYEPSQEVRFAVVMYGGVSLAIYIHGVIQELYRLVRATAPEPDNRDRALLADHELTGTEHVYRKLGQMLQRNGTKKEVKDNDPICTRFVVDIL